MRMQESFKCLHCGYEYAAPVDPKQKTKERVCPRCKSNSVRKVSSPKVTGGPPRDS